MNELIIKEIADNLQITEKQVSVVLNLLSEGNTIPFIARYRKEATGALDEEVIRSISEVYLYQENLLKRKEDVIRLIDEKALYVTQNYIYFGIMYSVSIVNRFINDEQY